MLAYLDDDLLIPTIETMRYLGEDSSTPERLWRFESTEVPVEEGGNSEMLLPDSQLWQVLDLPSLIQGLQQVSRLHPLKPPPPPAALASPSASILHTVDAEISGLFSDSSRDSVTITIKFTDDGFSIGRSRFGGLRASFFTHPWLDAGEEEKILSFFQRSAVTPQIDYRADKGRTRVLEFPLPDDVASVADICRTLLTEVYGMRADDTLVYSWHSSKK